MADLSPTDIVRTAVFSFLVLINLAGNVSVGIIVLGNHAMRTTMNFLLVNLAVADILVALSLLPQYALDHAFVHPSGTAGNYLCRFVTGGGLLWFGDKASVCILVIIAYERYLAVIYPITGRGRISRKTLFRFVFACWLFAFVLNAPNFWVPSYDSNPEFHCPEKWTSPILAKVYTMICYSVFGGIPLGVVVYLYTRVVYTLWDRKVNLTSAPSEQIIIQNRKKVTKMVIVVTLLFAVLRSPNLILYMLSQFDSGYKFASASYIASVALVALNSTVNPFVYSLHSTKFREHLIRLLRFKNRTETDNEQQTPLLIHA